MASDTKNNVFELKKRILKAWQLQVLFHEMQIRENQSAIDRIKKIIEEIEIDESEGKKSPVDDKQSVKKIPTQTKKVSPVLKVDKNTNLHLDRDEKGRFMRSIRLTPKPTVTVKKPTSRVKKTVANEVSKKEPATRRLSRTQPKTAGKANNALSTNHGNSDIGVKREKSAVQKRKPRANSVVTQQKAKKAMAEALETFETILRTPTSKKRVSFAPLFGSKERTGTRVAGTPIRKRYRSLPNPKIGYLLPMSPESIEASPTIVKEVVMVPE